MAAAGTALLYAAPYNQGCNAMSEDLYRREAIEAKQASWLGTALPGRGGHWAFPVGAALGVLALIVFFTLGSYTHREHVQGRLVSTLGIATLTAPVAGLVSRCAAHEGDRVRSGELICVVQVPRSTIAGADTTLAVGERIRRREDSMKRYGAAQRETILLQADGLRAQRDSDRQELRQIEAEVATRRKQLKLAEETLQRLHVLHEQNYVTGLQLGQQEAAALEQQAQAQALDREATVAKRSIEKSEQALRQLGVDADAQTATSTRDLALLDQERLEAEGRAQYAVRSPVNGVVSVQLVKEGEAVQAGQGLYSILPGDGRLEAELSVPSRAIGFIKRGDKVLLRYQAFPFQKFGHHAGRVSAISRSTLDSAVTGADLPCNPGESCYRVIVTLDSQSIRAYGRPELLRAGMVLDADVLGERRSLLEWMFEPLFALSDRGK